MSKAVLTHCRNLTVTDHRRQNSQISAMSKHSLRFFQFRALFLSLVHLSNDGVVSSRDASSESSSVSRVEHVVQFLHVHVEQVVEFDTSVGEFLEGSSFFGSVSHFC